MARDVVHIFFRFLERNAAGAFSATTFPSHVRNGDCFNISDCLPTIDSKPKGPSSTSIMDVPDAPSVRVTKHMTMQEGGAVKVAP